MKRIVTFVLIMVLIGCGSNPLIDRGSEPLSKEWLNERFSLGVIYKEQAGTGLEILLIAQNSNTFDTGLKSGWVLKSMEGVSLAESGSKLLSERLQNLSKSDQIEFVVDTGKELTEIMLTRQKFGAIKQKEGSWVEVK